MIQNVLLKDVIVMNEKEIENKILKHKLQVLSMYSDYGDDIKTWTMQQQFTLIELVVIIKELEEIVRVNKNYSILFDV